MSIIGDDILKSEKQTGIRKPKRREHPVRENGHTNRATQWMPLGGVFSISLGLLGFEIALTRLLSVILSYHYVFAVVSLTMLGFGVGGIFVHFFESNISDKYNKLNLLVIFASLCSLTMASSVIVVIQAAHLEIIGNNILLYCCVLFFPFFFGGMFLSEVFHLYPAISARIYSADLVGAATGCCSVIFVLNIFGIIGTILFFSVMSSMAALLFAIQGR